MKTPLRLVMLLRMNGYSKLLLPIFGALLLAACATEQSVVVEPAADYQPEPAGAPIHARAPGGSYQVVKSDTLYSIAFRNGVDYRDLASWNNIAEPYRIWPGQVLRLSPPGGHNQSGNGEVAAVAPAAHPMPVPAASRPAAPAAPVFEPVGSSSSAPAPVLATTQPPAPPPAAKPVPAPVAVPPPAPVHVAPSAPVAAATSAVVPVAGVPTPPRPPVAPSPATAPVVSGAARSSGGVNWRWPADGSLIKRFQSGDAIPGIEIAGKSGDPVRAAADGVVVYSGNGLVGYGELIIVKHSDSLLSAYGHNRKRLVTEGQKVSAGQQIADMGSTAAPRDELQFQIRRDGNPVDPLSYLPAH